MGSNPAGCIFLDYSFVRNVVVRMMFATIIKLFKMHNSPTWVTKKMYVLWCLKNLIFLKKLQIPNLNTKNCLIRSQKIFLLLVCFFGKNNLSKNVMHGAMVWPNIYFFIFIFLSIWNVTEFVCRILCRSGILVKINSLIIIKWLS